MQHKDATIDALAKIIELERIAVQEYGRAAHGNQFAQHLDLIEAIREAHASWIGRLDMRRDQLQKQEGEGFLGEIMESIGEAISGIVAGLPVDFLSGTSMPNIDTLQRAEEGLLSHYDLLRANTDDETAGLLDAAIESIRTHLGSLNQLRQI